MNLQGWGEILLAIGLAVGLAWPLGDHIGRVWAGEPTRLDPYLAPLERVIYRAGGIDPDQGQTWWRYALSLIAFNAAGFLTLYALLRLQGLLPLNPTGASGLSPDLAFSVTVGFITNTDWQPYAGERAISHLAQMVGLTTQMFASGGSAMAAAAALARAFRSRGRASIGNFWSDLARNVLYVLAPLSIGLAIALIALGVPQTLEAHVAAGTLEGARQLIALGPVASQEAIKQLGTNGGGFFGANAAHPFENPRPLTNLMEMVAMNAVGFACAIAFGRVVRAGSDARALVMVMALTLVAAAGVIYVAESGPTPALVAADAAPGPNLEGKELRFGAPGTAAFVAMTTGSSTGAVNDTQESLTPAGGGVALFMILLGHTLPGGVGAGLYNMLVMALLAVFLAGMLVGRTPEYLGKKIETREVKLAMLSALIVSATILGLSAAASLSPAALDSLSVKGAHGLTELFYAYASATENNGSAFAGLRADTPYLNTTLGLAMLIGKLGTVIPILAIAGGIAAKPKLAPTDGTFPTDGPLFVGLVTAVIIILTGLQFFPTLALGPIVEQSQMTAFMAAKSAASQPVRSPPPGR